MPSPTSSRFGERAASRWRWAVGAALTLITFVVLQREVPWGEVSSAVRLAGDGPLTLIWMAAAYTVAFGLRTAAWRLLMTTPAAPRQLFANLQTSLFLNHIFPFKAGEISRPLLAAHRGLPAGEAVATTVVARTLDFVALALIVLVALPVLSFDGAVAGATAVAIAAIAALAATLIAVRARPLAFGPQVLRQRAAALQTSLAAIPLARMATALPLVLLSWVLEGAVLLGAAELLGVEVSVGLAIAVTAFTIIFQVIHVTPGGIGVYETATTSALVSQGVPASDALALAVLTHALKFAYALSVGGVFAAGEGVFLLRGRREAPARGASRFEVVMARLWNVVNEGKPFTPLFTLTVIALLWLPGMHGGWTLGDAAFALAAIVPLAAVFYRFDFPLRLRLALWLYLGAFVVATGAMPLATVALVLGLYLGFTVVFWGTIYYHLRIGTRWTNGFRFARLVVENPDPTSGNFLEQVPKVLLLVLLFQFGAERGPADMAVAALAVTGVVAVSALLLHQWFFTWVPALPQPARPGIAIAAPPPAARARRVIAIVIDGCRADRLAEAHTPHIDALRATGLDVRAMSTVYPARTVTCFSSMLTGAPPSIHGMHSNFVPNLGIKCESVFDVLERAGKHGRLVGIAHLVDAFGDRIVSPVTAVMHNDDIDAALIDRARRVLLEEDPDLLVLQLLSVDQTGHARGSYNAEYLAKIEETDRQFGGFLDWCASNGYLHDTTILVTADHGQGIGIGGHGHMTPSEIRIPCIVAGAGVGQGVDEEPRFVTDIAATICATLGVEQPAASVGNDLIAKKDATQAPGPAVFIVPARNEAARLPAVFAAIAASGVLNPVTVVVDDGSTDATAAVARAHGAVVVQHERNRGLGAAVRTGLAAARGLRPRVAIYLDADGEYDAREAVRLLAPIERGEADYVLGSRFRGTMTGMPWSRRLANRAFTILLSICCRRRISDGQTGFRAFSPRALAVAEIVHDYNYAQVLTLDLVRKGMRMDEVPISYRRRSGGRSFISARYLWRVPAGMVREMLRP